MKSIKKTILTSVATIGLSAALIGGATVALFTSENTTNIAVGSGKVHLEAKVVGVQAYSAEWDEASATYVDKNLQANDAEGYSYTFTNTGTVDYDKESNLLSIDRITPGDGVKLQIEVTNESTVDIRYQTRVIISYPEGAEKGLGEALSVTIDGTKAKSAGVAYVTGWSDPIDTTVAIDDISVEISMPWGTENKYQGLGCDIAVTVYAIQGNASKDTPVADVLVNSADSLKDAFENAEDGDVIGLVDDVTITGDDELVVPKGADRIIDLAGKSFNVSNKKEVEGEEPTFGQGIIVEEGSTLTITDTTPNDDERGSFTVNAEISSDNLSDRENGSYSMRVNGGTLNIENVDFNIVNDNAGNHAVYVQGGTVNVDANSNIEFTGAEDNEGSFGMFISDGSEMNINGAYLHADGTIAPITVGGGEEESVVNVNAGSKIYVENSGSWIPAINVYPNGVANVYDNTEIKVYGNIGSGDAAAALGVTGGGTINVMGGEIILEPTSGEAYGVMIRANFFYENGEKAGQMSMANVTFSGNSVIKAIYGSYSYSVYAFLAQRNYVWNYGDGDFPGYDDSYAITIESTAQILYGKTLDTLTEIAFSHNNFARVGSGYAKVGAILDNRAISK